MSTVTKPNTFTAGTNAKASEVNANFDTIYNDYNGNITNANIAAGAAIVGSKLDLSSPGTIGATTPGLATFSNVTATTVTGTNLSLASGTSQSTLYINQTGVLTNGTYALYVYSNAVQKNAPLVQFTQDNATATQPALSITDDSIGNTINIDKNESGLCVALSQDANSATDCVGVYVAINNAGAGSAYALQVAGSEVSTTTAGPGAVEYGVINVKTAAGLRKIKLFI